MRDWFRRLGPRRTIAAWSETCFYHIAYRAAYLSSLGCVYSYEYYDATQHSNFIPPSHRRAGATAVLVRHKPQGHRHDRRGSAVVQSLISVAPRKTVKTANLRGDTAETFNMFRLTCSAVTPQYYPRHTEGAVPMRCLYDINRSGTAMIAVVPQWFRHWSP